METNLETVNRICASLELNFSLLDSMDRDSLIFIAYQYPRLGGEAVYRARAILGIDVDDTELAFRIQNMSDANRDGNFIVIPNPTTGEFMVTYSLKDDESASLELFDNLGKIISTNYINATSNFINFDMPSNLAGVYNLRIKTSSDIVINKKVVLIK
jgi:hypothetical protein